MGRLDHPSNQGHPACPQCDQLRAAIRERHPMLMLVVPEICFRVLEPADFDQAVAEVHAAHHVQPGPHCWKCDQVRAALRRDLDLSEPEVQDWIDSIHQRRHVTEADT